MDRTDDVLEFVERRSEMQLKAQAQARAAAEEEKKGKPQNQMPARGGKDKKIVEKPLFSTDLILSQATQDLKFSPELEDFQQALESAIDSAVKKIMAPKRLISDPDFLVYTNQNTEEGDDDQSVEFKLEAMVLQDPGFIEVKHSIKTGLANAFEKAFEYAQKFRHYSEIFVENEATDIFAMKDSTIDNFASLVIKYEEQIDDFKEMAESHAVGIIDVVSAGFKAKMLPSPIQRLNDVQKLLPSVGHNKTIELLEELKSLNAKISGVPATVEEFVQIKGYLSTCVEMTEPLQKRMAFISDLYQLMSDTSIKAPESDKNNFEKLAHIRKQFRLSIQYTDQSIEGNTDRFVKELETKIPVLINEIDAIEEDLQHPMIADVNANLTDVIEYLDDRNEHLESLEERAQRFQYYQEVLQVEVTPYEDLRERRADMNVKSSLWNSLHKWDEYSGIWMKTPFDEINVDLIAEQVKVYGKVASKARAMLEDNEVVGILREKVSSFKETLPVVQNLRNPHLLDRHWSEITELLSHDIKNDPEFTMGTLIDVNAMEHQAAIAVISTKAGQEAALNEMLQKVEDTWSELVFPVNAHKGAKDVFVLGNLEDVIAGLDESLVTINTILGSRFVDPIRDVINDWNHKLLLFQENLDEWITCQRSWMYLETIFSSGDITRQLPEETAAFVQVDKGWKEIMRRTNDNPIAIIAGTYSGLHDTLTTFNESLDAIQKQLEAYLETKRQAFPRFYFLSNDELILILSESKNVNAVQPHLRKCFDALVRVEFADKDIKAMFSGEGERVPLGLNLKARGSVEVWLSALESDMVKSLRRYMKKGVSDYENQARREWILEQFGQIVMTVSQIAWCRGCEQALSAQDVPKALDDWYEITGVKQVSELTAMVRGNLAKIDRKKIVALITTDVHSRDTVDKLRVQKVDNVMDFIWQQQLRFYWEVQEDDCIVRQSNAKIFYAYEYMGVCSRLVITPLTDRCWMTITGALHLRFGAAPAGPAGTGKTESTKDLAKAIGTFCVVFNCSDQINYKTMAKLFSGLAQAGAWTCLDEFNRIDIEVLSVVAQQLLTIRQALVAKVSEFLFEDQMINIRGVFGVMITMNPGYAGRTELPDNLKVLFRPVSMMIPDYALIAEIMLFAEGFDTASILSKKMTKLYKLSSEQLSQQDHYDFGMRAVKSVLVMAGSLKRSETHLTEDVVLIRAMKDSNIPKFLSDDIPLFEAIVMDLFPGVEIPPTEYGELEVYTKQAVEELGLQTVSKFVLKVIQLFDTFNVRFGVMIVGPTGAGKSACYNSLAKAMTNLREADNPDERFQAVHTHVLNPKCVTMGELYGDVNALTQEWTDGLASTIMREAIKDDSDDKHWVVFDGPVDALWIENMNTVLDDNMTLCLVNGERIKLKVELRMLFEVQDLAVASPATVSRCGMVYMTPSDLGILPYVRSWLPRLDEKTTQEMKDHIYSLFVNTITQGVKWLNEFGNEPISSVPIQVCTNCCCLFEAMWNEEHGIDFEMPFDKLQKTIDYLYAFSFSWAVGGGLDEDSQKKFCRWAMDIFSEVRLPGNVFNSFVDVAEQKWVHWDTRVPAFEFDPELPYSQVVVPTMDTVKYAWLMETLLEIERSVFYTGVSGVGKTVIIMDMFAQIKDTKNVLPVCIGFSAQTNARKTQENIEAKLVKLRKTQLGAPAGKKLVIFVDDLNMPETEEYGAQPPIELLRQFQDYKGFYDRTKLFWKQVVDTTIVCSAAPPGGGRSPTTPRFTRHFNVLCLPEPAEAVMKKIFGSILGGFLKPFKAPVQNCRDAIVGSTIEIYNTIRTELLPTPMKSHYTFNLRDISKVFQGILMIKTLNCTKAETMTRLWIHEVLRCFHDRLIDDIDQKWFTEKIIQLLSRQFKVSWKHEDLFEKKVVRFGNFFRPGVSEDYMEQPANVKLARIFSDYMDDYNSNSGSTMDLVFFDDAIEHISRIARILRQPRGNAMLVGVGGSGKQSLTKLACTMADYQCLQIELTRGYGYTDFQEHLKKLMIIAGVEGKQVVFLFNENQIIQERFLEDVNNILNAGEVPNLFPSDELLKVIDDLTPVVRDMGLPASRTVVYQMFVQRVRDNLHIVLCMSPVGDTFRVRCRQFPSLINCTTIDWFQKWPAQALSSVSTKFLEKVKLESEDHRTALAQACVEVHMTMDKLCDKFYQELRRKVYTTPKSYLDMVQLYLEMLAEKRNELETNRNRLVIGLQKLAETSNVVADLQETLTELKPVLLQKSKETDELLAQVTIDTEKADKVKAVVEVDAAKVSEQAAEVKKIQAEAQAELDIAMPAFNKAMKQLDQLKKGDISEVKGMGKPPEGVVKTMEAVCILFGVKPDWDSAKKQVLSRITLLQDLQTFDKDNIQEKVIKKLRKYVEDPELSDETRMKSISVAAASLMAWVNAMVIYSKVAKEVGPKKARVAEMNNMLKEANAKLKAKQDELAAVVEKVTKLKAKCDAAVNEKNTLNAKLSQTEGRMTRANKLTSGLSSESVRWKADSETLLVDIKLLVGNVFLSSACVSYFGPFTGEYREELSTNWYALCVEKGIPTAEGASLRNTLGKEVQVRSWNINGLPTDNVSVDSGILVNRASRYPLMIDPQEQGKKWIKSQYKTSNLAVTRFSRKDYGNLLERCIMNGYPLLIEDVTEEIDSSLDPLLTKQVTENGGRLVVRLGDKEVDFDANFKLFITTKLPNPHYLPEVCIKVTIINFTVTMSGLEDQLLGEVIKSERADVEERKNKLVVKMAEDKAALSDLEAKILKLLSESKGNILDDVILIETLAESKSTSNIINDRVAQAQETQIEINAIREKYRGVANRGSILYFVIADLGNVDPMYQYSLSFFLKLFNICLAQSEKSEDLDERLATLFKFTTEYMYFNICRGLFEAHKGMYAFMISCQIHLNDGQVKKDEWRMLLKPSAGLKPETEMPNNAPETISEKVWAFCGYVEENLVDFKGFRVDIQNNLEEWSNYVLSNAPHEQTLPGEWHERLSMFQRLIVLKIFREEKLLFACGNYVRDNLGQIFVDPQTTSLADVHRDTDNKTPIIFVLSVGADPTGLLIRFANEMKYGDRLNRISLGQGQGENAKRLVANAKKTGDWVLLQNCHLAKSFMPELETMVDNFADDDNIHEDFRLWLTSMPVTYFPVSVLQKGVKLTNEPPKGLRANLFRSLSTVVNQEEFEKHPKPEPFKKILFGLCFYHAIIQERKKFGPLGWNIMYEFNDSDLETSIQVLQMFLEEQEHIPWDALRYVCGHINYGGRVTDDWDRRCLMSILHKYFTPSILNDEYKFSESGIYFAPKQGEFQTYVDYVMSLPIEVDPEVFGMHENANISFQRSESGTMLNTILSLQPRDTGGGEGQLSPDEQVAQMAAEMAEVMPPQMKFRKPVNEDAVEEKEGEGDDDEEEEEVVTDSLSIVLIQEIDRFNRLISVITSTLNELQRAIRGEVVMSGALDAMYTSLLNNQVPSLWETVSYPSLKPLAPWIEDFHERVKFINTWNDEGPPNSFWLSGFFFPQGFMTAVLQVHARKYQLPIDALRFQFTVKKEYKLEDIVSPPEDGVYINGLYFDGARWDDDNMTIADAKLGELYCSAPIIHFNPSHTYKQDAKDYECPVYKTSRRAGILSTTGQSTNFVLAVDLPSTRPQDYWIQKGAAFLCALDF